GVHVFRSSNVTVANNTAFNNWIDPFGRFFANPQIDVNDGDNNVFVNNIAYAVPATSASDPRCRGANPCALVRSGIPGIVAFLGGNGGPGGTDSNNVWQNNVSFAPGSAGGNENAWFNDDIGRYTCSANKCSTDPMFVAPSDVSAPAYTVYSSGNFALQAGSPALGYAQTQPYLPWWTKDAGACDSSLVACP